MSRKHRQGSVGNRKPTIIFSGPNQFEFEVGYRGSDNFKWLKMYVFCEIYVPIYISVSRLKAYFTVKISLSGAIPNKNTKCLLQLTSVSINWYSPCTLCYDVLRGAKAINRDAGFSEIPGFFQIFNDTVWPKNDFFRPKIAFFDIIKSKSGFFPMTHWHLYCCIVLKV